MRNIIALVFCLLGAILFAVGFAAYMMPSPQMGREQGYLCGFIGVGALFLAKYIFSKGAKSIPETVRPAKNPDLTAHNRVIVSDDLGFSSPVRLSGPGFLIRFKDEAGDLLAVLKEVKGGIAEMIWSKLSGKTRILTLQAADESEVFLIELVQGWRKREIWIGGPGKILKAHVTIGSTSVVDTTTGSEILVTGPNREPLFRSKLQPLKVLKHEFYSPSGRLVASLIKDRSDIFKLISEGVTTWKWEFQPDLDRDSRWLLLAISYSMIWGE